MLSLNPRCNLLAHPRSAALPTGEAGREFLFFPNEPNPKNGQHRLKVYDSYGR